MNCVLFSLPVRLFIENNVGNSQDLSNLAFPFLKHIIKFTTESISDEDHIIFRIGF